MATGASIIEAALRAAGVKDVSAISDFNTLARRITEISPNAIIISLQNPAPSFLENLFQLTRAVQLPIAIFIDQADQATIAAAIEAGISAFVVNGLAENRIEPVLNMAISRFNATTRLAKELAETKLELENRKIIERAKGLIMASRKMDEAAAYHLLRSTAMKQSRTIAEVAQNLISSAALLNP